MTLLILCEHGKANAHKGTGYMREGRWHTVNEGIDCPGGHEPTTEELIEELRSRDVIVIGEEERRTWGFANRGPGT